MVRNDIIKYLPDFMQDFKEIKAICDAVQLIINELGPAADSIVNNAFIADCDEDTISRYESMLNITPDENDSISLRKTRILLEWSTSTVYNYNAIIQSINSVCGDAYSIENDLSNYRIIINTFLDTSLHIIELKKALDSILPMNVYYEVVNAFSRTLSNSINVHKACISTKFVTVRQSA